MLSRALTVLSASLLTSPAIAQDRLTTLQGFGSSLGEEQSSIEQQPEAPVDRNDVGRTAESAAGQVGERQSREITALKGRIQASGRISNRIQNRVQNRVQNRIDRYYDPSGGASDPFGTVGDQLRVGRAPR